MIETPAELADLLSGVCVRHPLPDVLRALAELCDRDAESYVRDLDDSGIIDSCRLDAEELRRLAGEMEARHGG